MQAKGSRTTLACADTLRAWLSGTAPAKPCKEARLIFGGPGLKTGVAAFGACLPGRRSPQRGYPTFVASRCKQRLPTPGRSVNGNKKRPFIGNINASCSSEASALRLLVRFCTLKDGFRRFQGNFNR